MFSEELNMVKKEFSRSPSLPLSQPQYAGRATWARTLKKRIDAPMKVRGRRRNYLWVVSNFKFSGWSYYSEFTLNLEKNEMAPNHT